MGLHASPELAPGAWVALRSYGDNHPLPGDYGFLMQHVSSEGYDEDLAAPQALCVTVPTLLHCLCMCNCPTITGMVSRVSSLRRR